MRIIDTLPRIDSLFRDDGFDLTKWETYINSIYKDSARLFKNDLKECLDSGRFTYENDVLPIINTVRDHRSLHELHASFQKVTNDLQERISACFGRELEIDIVLYLGLCNAAGWVTTINGRDVILLGIEKILELNWCDEDSMYGLIYHELGHVYHKQHGVLDQYSNENDQQFVWQLFTEGIAMVFEQTLVNDFAYYHQNTDGWLTWCEDHFLQILSDFSADLPTMTRATQRYFGDWVAYCGRGDVGYYLGTKFVQHLCQKEYFDQLIKKDIHTIYQDYLIYTEEHLHRKAIQDTSH